LAKPAATYQSSDQNADTNRQIREKQMRDIRKRVEKLERTVGVGKKPYVICIKDRMFNEREAVLPENVEEWLTYQTLLQENPDFEVIVLLASNELKARELQRSNKNQPKTTKMRKH